MSRVGRVVAADQDGGGKEHPCLDRRGQDGGGAQEGVSCRSIVLSKYFFSAKYNLIKVFFLAKYYLSKAVHNTIIG